jgi:hypothetical protein
MRAKADMMPVLRPLIKIWRREAPMVLSESGSITLAPVGLWRPFQAVSSLIVENLAHIVRAAVSLARAPRRILGLSPTRLETRDPEFTASRSLCASNPTSRKITSPSPRTAMRRSTTPGSSQNQELAIRVDLAPIADRPPAVGSRDVRPGGGGRNPGRMQTMHRCAPFGGALSQLTKAVGSITHCRFSLAV